jgi:hypothetical protein
MKIRTMFISLFFAVTLAGCDDTVTPCTNPEQDAGTPEEPPPEPILDASVPCPPEPPCDKTKGSLDACTSGSYLCWRCDFEGQWCPRQDIKTNEGFFGVCDVDLKCSIPCPDTLCEPWLNGDPLVIQPPSHEAQSFRVDDTNVIFILPE